MATLTYDSTPADQPEFSEEEVEALQRGEEMLEEEQQLLAGKYRDAEELEKAYMELQKKLGSNEDEEDGTPSSVEDEETEEEWEYSEGEALIMDASTEFAETGELSAETMEQFAGMSSADLVQAYMDMRAKHPEETQASEVAEDLSDSQVNQIKNAAGGEEAYSNLVSWASDNLPEQYINAFDNIIESGNMEAINLAVAGLKSEFEEVNGYEGRLLSGKSAPQVTDAFRSQAEVVQAMSDPRYDTDPAYRNDVFEKLGRSNIDY